MTVIFDTLIIW